MDSLEPFNHDDDEYMYYRRTRDRGLDSGFKCLTPRIPDDPGSSVDQSTSFSCYRRCCQTTNQHNAVRPTIGPRNDNKRSINSYVLANLHIIGLDRVLDKRRPICQRVFWSTALLLGFSFLLYHLRDRIQYFGSDPISVDVRIEEPSQIDFPQITLCQNYYHPPRLKSKLATAIYNAIADRHTDDLQRHDEADIPTQLFPNKSSIQQQPKGLYNDTPPEHEHQYNYTEDQLLTFDWSTFLRTGWPELSDVIPFCVFRISSIAWRNQHCKLLAKHLGGDATYPRDTDLFYDSLTSSCVTLSHNWSSTGFDSYAVIKLARWSPFDRNVGITHRVVVHGRKHSPRLRENSFEVSHRGHPTRVYVELKLTEFHSLPPRCGGSQPLAYFGKDTISNTPSRMSSKIRNFRSASHSEENNSDAEKNSLPYDQVYTKFRCELECFINFSLSEGCRCVAPFAGPFHKANQVCAPHRWHRCFEDAWLAFRKINTAERCGCLEVCQEQTYEAFVRSSQIRKKRPGAVANDYSLLIIKFKTTRYTIIEQHRGFTLLRLLAEIGGALGLALGIRLLTLAELLDVIILTISLPWRRRLQSRRRRLQNY